MTHAEAFEIAKAEMVSASGGRVKAATVDTEGTTTYMEAHAIAAVAEEVAYQSIGRHRNRFVDTGEGEGLSRLGHDSYDVQRSGATSSVTGLTFTRTDDSADVTIVAGTVIRTSDGVRFALDQDVTLAAGVATSVDNDVTSILAGISQNVDASTITIWESAAPQSDMTATNPEAAAGGNDAETDYDYKARIRNAWITARRGTWEALREGALSVDQVREAAVYEALDDNGNETGTCTVIIADSEGNSNSTLEAAVDAELDAWRAAGIHIVVSGATVDLESIDVSPVWKTGAATSANDLALRKAIVAYVNRLNPNAAPDAASAPEDSWLDHGLIQAAARNITGLIGLTVNTPTGTTKPDSGHVIRTTLASVTTS